MHLLIRPSQNAKYFIPVLFFFCDDDKTRSYTNDKVTNNRDVYIVRININKLYFFE